MNLYVVIFVCLVTFITTIFLRIEDAQIRCESLILNGEDLS